ncbi:MAG: transposase [Iphinoe sp. HA4291-MV1]|nr:transposase [Iphinoe sp. HA4291-MV1]
MGHFRVFTKLNIHWFYCADLLIWDGASYHRSVEIREYLASINQNLPSQQWKITCIRLAPYAPEQNPVVSAASPTGEDMIVASQELCPPILYVM